jgi:hypothetical protein
MPQQPGPFIPAPGSPGRAPVTAGGQANLADILERVLDKGIVIAGDIRVNLLDIELLTIKIRLIVASVDRAREMGIDWWEHDPSLSSGRHQATVTGPVTGPVTAPMAGPVAGAAGRPVNGPISPAGSQVSGPMTGMVNGTVIAGPRTGSPDG